LPTVLPEKIVDLFSTYVSPPIMQAFSYVAPMCTPISMFIIGALLAGRTPKQLLTNGKIYYLCALKLVIFPLLICGSSMRAAKLYRPIPDILPAQIKIA